MLIEGKEGTTRKKFPTKIDYCSQLFWSELLSQFEIPNILKQLDFQFLQLAGLGRNRLLYFPIWNLRLDKMTHDCKGIGPQFFFSDDFSLKSYFLLDWIETW